MAKQTHIVHSDDPVRVTVEPLTSNDLSWFRLFRSVVHSGVWAKLTPAAAKVLVVLAECVNDAIRKEQNRWIAWPSIATIGLRAGVERRAAQKAIALLEEHGLVRRCRRRNASRGDYSNEYELTPPPAHAGAQGGAAENAQEGVFEKTPDRASVSAPRPRSAKRSPGAAARAQQSTDKKETRSDSSIRAKLVSAGIGEPTLSRLLDTESEEELLLRLQDWETRKRVGSKFGVAWLISSIQQKYELHERTLRDLDQAEKRAAAQNRRQAELEEQAKEDERQRAIEARAQAMFDEMSDEELAHWKGVVLKEFPGIVRNADRADPRASNQLRTLILAKLGHLVCPPETPGVSRR
jgi:hypothetical protein